MLTDLPQCYRPEGHESARQAQQELRHSGQHAPGFSAMQHTCKASGTAVPAASRVLALYSCGHTSAQKASSSSLQK